MPPPSSPPQNLADWLAIATGKLVPSAQERVRAEIETHYAEAVKAHRQAGATEADAQKAALADLGHAAKAARRLSREHLTQRDLINLREQTQPAIYFVLFFLLLAAILFKFAFPNNQGPLLIMLMILTRRKAQASLQFSAQDIDDLARLLLRRFFIGCTVNAVLIGAALAAYIQVSLGYKSDEKLLDSDFWMFFMTLLASFGFVVWFQGLQLRRKLLRVGRDELANA